MEKCTVSIFCRSLQISCTAIHTTFISTFDCHADCLKTGKQTIYIISFFPLAQGTQLSVHQKRETWPNYLTRYSVLNSLAIQVSNWGLRISMSDFQSSSNWIYSVLSTVQGCLRMEFQRVQANIAKLCIKFVRRSVQSFGRFCTFRKDNDNKANNTFSYFIVVFWILRDLIMSSETVMWVNIECISGTLQFKMKSPRTSLQINTSDAFAATKNYGESE